MKQKDYTALVNKAKRLSYEYYVLANPSVSDAQFDALVAEIEQAENEHPEWVLADSPTQMVGSDLQDNGRRLIRHRTRMLSCQKAQTQEAVTKWLAQTEKKLKGAQVYALEWKYDGISCSLVYQDGELISAATRGDKDCGQDLLAHALLIPSVPSQIKMMGRVEVRGEIVCPKAELRSLGYKDCRTAAAALTNQVMPAADIDKLVFLAWQMDMDELTSSTESVSIKAAQELGFHAEEVRTCKAGNILSVLDDYAAERDALPYPTDGVVIKIDNKQAAASLGYTEHHPKGNIAYKFGAQKTTTKVLRIEISVGRTGKRTPVAYLQPVMIMGREVKQASLYSENKMRELGITEGCTVEVGLSNDVTPKIYRVVSSLTPTEHRREWESAPLCGAAATFSGYSKDPSRSEERELSSISEHQASDIRHQTSLPQRSGSRSSRVHDKRSMFNVQCSMGQSNLLRNSPSREQPEPTNKINPIYKALGEMVLVAVAMLIIWHTGLLIPVGILGLISAGLMK